jgi:ribonuclease HI
MSFYAVVNGRTVGVFSTWSKCNESVKGYKNALFKKFDTLGEAEEFIQSNILNCFIPDYYVYTDGACSNNGKSNACAGIGIFFGPNDLRNVSKRVEGKQTNNVAELNAIIKAYSIIEEDIVKGKRVAIMSDSLYAIRSLSMSVEGDIPNKELVKKAQSLYNGKPNIKLIHVKAHTNKKDIHSIGNENADLLAVQSIA